MYRMICLFIVELSKQTYNQCHCQYFTCSLCPVYSVGVSVSVSDSVSVSVIL